jgi:hypothetical protein
MCSKDSIQFVFEKKKTFNDYHTYYVPKLHHLHAFFIWKHYKSFYPCKMCGMRLLFMAFQVQDVRPSTPFPPQDPSSPKPHLRQHSLMTNSLNGTIQIWKAMESNCIPYILRG